MDQLPRPVCHGDFNYNSLFARDLPGHEAQTLAIDWQYAGLRQIGEDIAGFIADSSINPVRRKATEPEELTTLMLSSCGTQARQGRCAPMCSSGHSETDNEVHGSSAASGERCA